MKIHILGIGGTFMAGLAVLAKQLGFEVSGSDEKVYPPMSTQLQDQAILLKEGYQIQHLKPPPDCVVIGNVIRRDNPVVEYILNEKLNFISGPQWLYETILKKKRVIAISGTHGKTTTSSLVAHIFEQAGLNPGFLIGGIPENFGISARITESPFFIIEADEYDSAFFDKRPKFMHYYPESLIINNIEFDHADVFSDLESIQTQFHYLVRTVPSKGCIVVPAKEKVVDEVLARGCWTPNISFGLCLGDWQAKKMNEEGSQFHVFYKNQFYGEVNWNLIGMHNVKNALAALAVAEYLGISKNKVLEALHSFRNVKRRLEVKGVERGITVYDDFAHHPTAIETTLSGLRARIGEQRLIVLLELGSYSMKAGVHKDSLIPALAQANEIYFLRPSKKMWDIETSVNQLNVPHAIFNSVEEMISTILPRLRSQDHVVAMSNSAFEDVHEKLLLALRSGASKVVIG